MQSRIPDRIIQSVIDDNASWLPPHAVLLIHQLQAQLRSFPTASPSPDATASPPSPSALPCSLPSASDPLWLPFLPLHALPWADIPWLYAEIFLYRLLHSLAHSPPPPAPLPPGLLSLPPSLPDLFAQPKEQSTLASLPAMIGALSSTQHHGNENPPASREFPPFYSHFLASLWGNQADLALFSVSQATAARDRHLLLDDMQSVHAHLSSTDGSSPAHPSAIHIVLDNVGMELFSDLLLARYLLDAGFCQQVVLHAKDSPFFVSDVTLADIPALLCLLSSAESALAQRWSRSLQDDYLAPGKISISTHPFWTAPLHFAQMPDDLRCALRSALLVITKGDLNYRRLIGDRHWSPFVPFSRAVSYFCAPVLALRTNKSALIVGLPSSMDLTSLPSDWLISGVYAVMSFNL